MAAAWRGYFAIVPDYHVTVERVFRSRHEPLPRQTDLSKLTPKTGGIAIQFQNAKFADVTKLVGYWILRFSPCTGCHVTDPISLKFTQASFADVFRFLVTAAKVDYTVVDDKTVLITNKP